MSWIENGLNWCLENPKLLSSSLGLGLDIIGITILFFFQVDRNHALREDGAVMLRLEHDDPTEQTKWKWYRKLTNIGFVVLFVGFALQLLALYMP